MWLNNSSRAWANDAASGALRVFCLLMHHPFGVQPRGFPTIIGPNYNRLHHLVQSS
jgi:hypothetical protein